MGITDAATATPCGRGAASTPPGACSPSTITSRRALAADLAAGRVRGWYVTRDENVADVMAVATPVAINEETFARMTPRLERHAAAPVAARRMLEAGG